MTDDDAHEVYLEITAKLKTYVNNLFKEAKLAAEVEEDIRMLLTETVRFWKE